MNTGFFPEGYIVTSITGFIPIENTARVLPSYREPLLVDCSAHTTLIDANDAVVRTFYELNPFGWGKEEMDFEELDASYDERGLLSLSMYPVSGMYWEVNLMLIFSLPHYSHLTG
jgi:hypothetical protein